MILTTSFLIFGLVLLYMEFFLPGGVMGVIGGGFIIASIFLMILVVKSPIYLLIAYIACVIFVVFLTVRLALRQLKKKKNSMYLDTHQEGFVASFHQKELYGKEAVAHSDLKPAGYIEINDEYYQAVSKAGYIKKGETVKIIGGEGARLIVQKIGEK